MWLSWTGCDSPQHSIALMRERDMGERHENDDPKVALPLGTRESKSLPTQSSRAIRKAVEDPLYRGESGEAFDVVLFDLPERSAARVWVYTVAAMDYIFVPLKADNIVK